MKSAVERGESDPLYDPTALPPIVDQRRPDAPRRRVVVIGAGPGGIIAARSLRLAGYAEVLVLEKADGPGGTWRHNRYPGAACDVQAHLYSFSFAPNPDWSRPYAEQPELLEYFERVVDDEGLRDCMRFGVEVTSVDWDDALAEWHVATASGDRHVADVVVSAIGMFNELSIPDIDGLESFAGPCFHTARWPEGLQLEARRVAVIGSAATAVQMVPAIAPVVGHLDVFQRSAPWVMPKLDDPFTAEQKRRFATDPAARLALRRQLWDRVEGAILFSDASVELSRNAALANLESVDDPATRRRLMPTGPFGCSRPLTASNWYPTFNRANVALVTESIDRIEPDAVVTFDGVRHECDVLILSTGFQATRYLSSIDVTGRDGVRLVDEWNDGAIAWLGIATSGFPNLFQLYGPNTNNGSIIYMLECQVDLIVRELQRMDEHRLAWIDVRPEAQAAYNDEVQERIAAIGPWAGDGCSNYYRSESGRVVTQCPFGMAEYRRRTTSIDDATSWFEAELD